jgi:hypothetical protein
LSNKNDLSIKKFLLSFVSLPPHATNWKEEADEEDIGGATINKRAPAYMR